MDIERRGATTVVFSLLILSGVYTYVSECCVSVRLCTFVSRCACAHACYMYLSTHIHRCAIYVCVYIYTYICTHIHMYWFDYIAIS